jgi:dolichol-phosphate mannosyltransferase
MVAHHGKTEHCEDQRREQKCQEIVSPQTLAPQILILIMASAALEPSFISSQSDTAIAPAWEGQRDAAAAKLALVIPTLCEAGNIVSLLDCIRTVLDPLAFPYEILVVDDDSRDGTAELVSAIAASDLRIRLLVRKGQRGLSGAVLHGWQRTDAELLAVMDADHQHPPQLLQKLLSAILQGHDLAIGSRYARGGEVGEWNRGRKLLSTAAVWSTWPLQRLRFRTKDPMSGFFIVRRRCIEDLQLQQSGFKLLLEVLMRGRIQSVAEIPFEFGCRNQGASKANLSVAFDYLRLLVKLYVEKLRFRGSST